MSWPYITWTNFDSFQLDASAFAKFKRNKYRFFPCHCRHWHHFHHRFHHRRNDYSYHNMLLFMKSPVCLLVTIGPRHLNGGWSAPYIEGILPKGPYLPCVSIAGRSLLAGYHRYAVSAFEGLKLSLFFPTSALNNVWLTKIRTCVNIYIRYIL